MTCGLTGTCSLLFSASSSEPSGTSFSRSTYFTCRNWSDDNSNYCKAHYGNDEQDQLHHPMATIDQQLVKPRPYSREYSKCGQGQKRSTPDPVSFSVTLKPCEAENKLQMCGNPSPLWGCANQMACLLIVYCPSSWISTTNCR